MKLNIRKFNSDIGKLTICSKGDYIIFLGFGTAENELFKYFSRFFDVSGFSDETSSVITRLERELSEYFNKARKIFGVKYKLYGTEFRQKVWHELEKIPYGTTRSYGDIAKAIDSPKASRAVGGANHNNPLSIIVPCHRVLGSDGSLTGYGGGLDIKEKLLKLEGII